MPRFTTPISLPVIADQPATPLNSVVIYARSDGRVYARSTNGGEFDLTQTGATNAVTTDTLGLEINVDPEPPSSPAVYALWLDTDEIPGELLPTVSEPSQNVVVSETNPNLTVPGLWVQTFENGDMTFWVEDGE